MIEVIVFYYPNAKIGNLVETANKWYLFLHDQEYQDVMDNLGAHIKTSVYPPHMADLLKVPEKRRDRYIPTREEVLSDFAKRDQLLLANKATEEERLKAQAEVKRILNISEVTKNE